MRGHGDVCEGAGWDCQSGYVGNGSVCWVGYGGGCNHGKAMLMGELVGNCDHLMFSI